MPSEDGLRQAAGRDRELFQSASRLHVGVAPACHAAKKTAVRHIA